MRESKCEGEREKGESMKERESQAGFMLSVGPEMGLNPTTWGIMSRAEIKSWILNQLRHQIGRAHV